MRDRLIEYLLKINRWKKRKISLASEILTEQKNVEAEEEEENNRISRLNLLTEVNQM